MPAPPPPPGTPGSPSPPAPEPSPEPGPEPARDPQALQEELDAARQEVDHYREALSEFPEIFESKFRQRLDPLLRLNQQLAGEARRLRQAVNLSLPPAAEQPAGNAGATPWKRLLAISLGSALLALLVAGGVLFAGRRTAWKRPPTAPPATPGPVQPSATATPAPAAAPDPRSFTIAASGTSWVDIRMIDGSEEGRRLYVGTMENGSKVEAPLGQGFRLLSGRPHLITVRLGTAAPALLGTVDDIRWFRFEAPSPEPAP